MKLLKGIVVKSKTDKTAVVLVERVKVHPIYKKRLKVKKKFIVHDEKGVRQGDRVRNQECRPVSKRKRWRVIEVVKKKDKNETDKVKQNNQKIRENRKRKKTDS